MEWAKRPIEKYADFTGRASRAEYWWYCLAILIAYIIVGIVESILGIHRMIFYSYGPLSALLWLATIVPSLAVGVRRLHDTNRPGWWVLLPIVPYFLGIVLGGAVLVAGAATGGGGIGMMAGAGIAGIFMLIGFVCVLVLLYFMVQSSAPGDNQYGPNPFGDIGPAIAAE
jgi:uncharacterized membrane protein YhaH (DUF805 family)